MTLNLIDMKGMGKSTVILAELDIVLAVQE